MIGNESRNEPQGVTTERRTKGGNEKKKETKRLENRSIEGRRDARSAGASRRVSNGSHDV